MAGRLKVRRTNKTVIKPILQETKIYRKVRDKVIQSINSDY